MRRNWLSGGSRVPFATLSHRDESSHEGPETISSDRWYAKPIKCLKGISLANSSPSAGIKTAMWLPDRLGLTDATSNEGTESADCAAPDAANARRPATTRSGVNL